MTVSSIIPVNNYYGNGSNKKFDFDFLIENANEIEVSHISKEGIKRTLTQGIDYSINEVGNKNGSYITFPLEQSTYDVLQDGEAISLVLSLEIKQESEFENSSNLNLSVLEWTFDYIIRIIQMLSRRVERAVKVEEGEGITSDELLTSLNEAQKSASESAALAAEKAQEASDCSATAVIKSEQAITTADKALDVLNNALSKTSTSNCVTEVPQNIIWEYVTVSGIKLIKIKAGSVITIPNGFESDGTTKKFIYKEIESDMVIDGVLMGHKLFCAYNTNVSKFTSAIPFDYSISGTTAPTSFLAGYALWYDTSMNVIKWTSDSGGTWTSGLSFPIALIETEIDSATTTGGITNIQVFNGCGYLGSITWVDKGLKALFADGLNSDGTYKNKEYTFSETLIYNLGTQTSLLGFLTIDIGVTGYGVLDYFEQASPPSMTGEHAIWYDTVNNIVMSTTNAGSTWTKAYKFFIGTLLKSGESKILSFNPVVMPLKIATNESLEYRDIKKIGDPILTLSSILGDGEVWLEGATVSRNSYRLLFAKYGETYGAGDGSTTFKLPDFRNRAIWGADSFGYISAGLPNVTGTLGASSNYVAGGSAASTNIPGSNSLSAAYMATLGGWGSGSGYGLGYQITLNAAGSSSIYGSSTTVQPNAIKVRVKTRYK